MKKRTIGLLAALTIMAALPFLVNALEQTGDFEKARANSPHQFANLSGGKTHYAISGSNSDSCVVLLHGASGPMSGWDRTIPSLAEAGHKVIAYDLFGRGLSDRPDVTYDRALFRRQLDDLLTELNCNVTSLVGSSMGNIVAADFAVQYPKRVNRVAIIGPAGFEIEATPIANLLQIPGVGKYGISVTGRRSLMRHNKKYYWQADLWPETAENYEAQFLYPGFKRATLSTMRNMPMNDFRSGYKMLGESDVETILIWGRRDITFPHKHFEDAKALLTPLQAITIEEAAHKPQYEQADIVNGLLVEFLSERQD